MKNSIKYIIFFIFSVALGFALKTVLTAPNSMQTDTDETDTALYWVAPMDPNFRRDKPGNSPMGMALIPVYKNDSGQDSGPGTVTIAPEVINNLGVRTAMASYKIFHSTISSVGYVKYDEEKLIHVHPRVAGWVEKLYVKAAGDPVKKGQALYELYSPTLVNAQEELLLALKRNNPRLIRAAEERLKALNLPAATISKLKQTRTPQTRIVFYSPQDGVIDKLNIREGFFAQPNTMLMSIGNLDQVWVDAEIFERQANEVSPGLPVSMTLPYLPGQEWLGKVDYIYPTLDPKTRTIKVRLRFKNPQQVLKPNMFAQITLHLKDQKKSLLIPKEAVIRTADTERVVLALGKGRFKSVNIKVGRYDDRNAEVLAGLNAGDKIVASAQFLLDSESAQSSDFKRMSAYDNSDTDMSSNNEMQSDEDKIWVAGHINTIEASHRLVNITHQAINTWMRPQMTMGFPVSESVKLNQLKTNSQLYVQIKANDNNPEITAVQGINTLGPDNSAQVNGIIKAIDTATGRLTIERQAIEKWQRGIQTIEFSVLQNLDLSGLKPQQKINFEFFIHQQELIIKHINPAPKGSR